MFRGICNILGATLLMCGVGACGDAGAEGARSLLAQTDSAIAAANYNQAIALLDTLNARHRDQTEARREGLRLRAVAMEGLARDSIELASAELAAATVALDSLRPGFDHIAGPEGVEGFFVPRGTSTAVMGATSVQGRVDEQGYFYVVVNVSGRRPGISSLRVEAGADSWHSGDIAAARIVDVGASQSASFSPEDVDGLGEWLAGHPSASKIVIVGRRGDTAVRLTPVLYRELTATAAFARALQRQRLASIHREKYERMLATARDQIANLTNVAADE
ncbi:MAG: hypothetical protein J6C67_02620 [Muribaculaceae bacterium]|nr:hypothetical protein [Muribaculaceae bacterium]